MLDVIELRKQILKSQRQRIRIRIYLWITISLTITVWTLYFLGRRGIL